ncbi:MAG: ATP-binding protein [Chloroflexota bacterium]|nr:ATP-binding protein [Chloroflexota bacterium]
MATFHLSEDATASAVLAERLGRAEIFIDLELGDLLEIAGFCQEVTLREGEFVLSEGQPANAMYVVERGKLALEKKIQIGRHSTPRNATIGYIGPGKIAGFSTLTTPHVYSTSVVCIEPTRAILIDGEILRDYLQSHPAAGLKVMNRIAALISGRYRNATNTLTYFLSIVSHELRSPLAAIENYLQTMYGGYAGDLNEKQKRMIQRSILRVTDLSGLIGDVVDLARMRPEQIQADFQWLDPGEVGTESIEDARLAAAEKAVKIRVEPPHSFEPIVGARRRLRQVFTNLLNNAIKFAPEDSTVIFRAYYTPEAVIFEIQDEGPGIPQDEIPYIFQEFFRASNVGETAGAGLGLSIAKMIVDAHYGQIQVKNITSEFGGTGTCFTVTIPRNLLTPEMRRQTWMKAEEEQ